MLPKTGQKGHAKPYTDHLPAFLLTKFELAVLIDLTPTPANIIRLQERALRTTYRMRHSGT